MTKLKALLIGAGAILLISHPMSFAAAQSALTISDNDSIFVDGNSFRVVPGKGKGDASALIRSLGAQALGPGVVVFRSGDKLYMADAGPIEAVRLGSDRDASVSAAQAERDWKEWQEFVRQNPRYGSDRYGSDREAGPTTAQGERERQDWPEDRRRYYGSDRDTSVSAAQAQRDWQEFIRQNPRYGSGPGAYASAGYGSTRDTGVSAQNRRYYSYQGDEGFAHYGSDRDESPSTAQSEREWREWLQSQRQGNNRRYYGSDREAGPTTAQGERERQDWPQDRRRYYGSDRDTSVSAAQAERDWQEWQRSLRQNSRYGSDRYGSDRFGYAFAPSATHNGAVAGFPRSGCDNAYNYDRALDGYSYDLVCNGRDLSPHASDRYGSDRDTSVSAAQAARDWQEFVRQNPRYGSDRDESVSAAQAERDWQEYLHQNRRYGSDRIVIDDPEYADYKLKKIFSDNWTANESAR
jgi:hypothetical protein